MFLSGGFRNVGVWAQVGRGIDGPHPIAVGGGASEARIAKAGAGRRGDLHEA